MGLKSQRCFCIDILNFPSKDCSGERGEFNFLRRLLQGPLALSPRPMALTFKLHIRLLSGSARAADVPSAILLRKSGQTATRRSNICSFFEGNIRRFGFAKVISAESFNPFRRINLKNILDILTKYVYNPKQPINSVGIQGKGEGQMKRYAKTILNLAECCCCMMRKYHIAYLPCIS